MAVGMLIHFFGFRIALHVRPNWARAMGDVVTAQEQSAIEADYQLQLQKLQAQHEAEIAKNEKKHLALISQFENKLERVQQDLTLTTLQFNRDRKEIDSLYRKKLDVVNNQLSGFAKDLGEISALKERFVNIATPAPIKPKMNDAAGRGGPFNPVDFKLTPSTGIDSAFDETLERTESLSESTKIMHRTWIEQYQLLTQLPIGAPLPRGLGMNSNYGLRIDPITQATSLHSGIDFVAKVGTPIQAAGDGTILKAGWDGAYGLTVEISHAEGYVSKYAHAGKIDVVVGQQVKRGQKLAEVGMTGRTTGAHLHFEILRNGQFVNPMQVLVAPDSKSR